MKKPLKISIMIITFLFLSLSVIGCDGCGPQASAKEISVLDYFGNTTLTLKTTVYNVSYGGTGKYFDSDMSLENLKVLINSMTDENITYEAQIYNDVVLIRMRSGKTSYFSAKILDGSTKRFALTNMKAFLGETSFLFPYHFCQGLETMAGTNQSDLLYTFSNSDEIKLDATYEELKEFYSALGRSEYIFDDNDQTINDLRIKLTVLEIGNLKIESY